MIVLFDGVCNLCNGFVQFVIQRDPQGLVQFTSLQSEVGQQLLSTHDLPAETLSSVVVIKNDKAFTRSAAVLTLLPMLGWQWQWLRLGWLLPARLRDGIYNWVAAHRYQWFGKQEACMIPTPELRKRFL